MALARALSNHPKLLLADEPTGNLDQETGREIVELLFRLQEERRMTLLLITHEPPLAARCARQLRMADGRLHEPIVAGQRRRSRVRSRCRMRELALAWRLARRELRGGLRGFGVFLACLTLGVAAIAAVGTINAGVIDGVKRDAAALLGGDVRLEASNLPIPEEALVEVTPAGARRSDVVETNAMAYGSEGRHVVVGLKAVDDAYPLYGEVGLDPPLDLASALADGGAVVEPGLLARLGLKRGDPIRIGEATFTVRATILREPDRIGGFISIGPRVIIDLADLERTRVILPGSLARYDYRLALPPGADVDAALAAIRAADPDARWRARGAARRAAADHPLHRSPRQLPDHGRPDRALDRRGRHRARDPELSGAARPRPSPRSSASARRAS